MQPVQLVAGGPKFLLMLEDDGDDVSVHPPTRVHVLLLQDALVVLVRLHLE